MDDATADLYKSPQMQALYDRWFVTPIPPNSAVLNLPMSKALAKAQPLDGSHDCPLRWVSNGAL
ncbi:hypothetical protein [Caballeronia pedi]|nr:hypothetical protein [Caballeronia pedi]